MSLPDSILHAGPQGRDPVGAGCDALGYDAAVAAFAELAGAELSVTIRLGTALDVATITGTLLAHRPVPPFRVGRHAHGDTMNFHIEGCASTKRPVSVVGFPQSAFRGATRDTARRLAVDFGAWTLLILPMPVRRPLPTA